MQRWQLQEAKARLSELVKCAADRGPQEITVHGKPVAVIVSRPDFDKLKEKKKKLPFLEFMRNSPLYGLELDFERDKSMTRERDFPDFKE